MKIKRKVIFDLESNPELRFQVIFEALNMMASKGVVVCGETDLISSEAKVMLKDLWKTYFIQCFEAENNVKDRDTLKTKEPFPKSK